jgi:hypothetical protein
MNRYLPHVYVIPEDDCDRQLADGFVLHDQVKTPRIQVLPPVGGWREVLKEFQTVYINRLREDREGNVVLLIDFDGEYNNRRAEFEQRIPDDLKQRVFVVGASHTPEELRKAMGKSFEQIGKDLAEDCFAGTETTWNHPQLAHNGPDRQKLLDSLRKILF